MSCLRLGAESTIATSSSHCANKSPHSPHPPQLRGQPGNQILLALKMVHQPLNCPSIILVPSCTLLPTTQHDRLRHHNHLRHHLSLGTRTPPHRQDCQLTPEKCWFGSRRLQKAIALFQKTYPGGSSDAFNITWKPYYLDPDAPSKGWPVLGKAPRE